MILQGDILSAHMTGCVLVLVQAKVIGVHFE